MNKMLQSRVVQHHLNKLQNSQYIRLMNFDVKKLTFENKSGFVRSKEQIQRANSTKQKQTTTKQQMFYVVFFRFVFL